MKVLVVLTSHSGLGNTGQKTGFWIEEFASPYYALKDAGVGQPPIDPKSDEIANQIEATHRFDIDEELKELLAYTKKLSEVSADDLNAVFYPELS